MVKGVEKKNKIFFIVLFVVLVAIVIVFGLQTYTPEIKAYSNMTDLYSLFTENMQEFVDYRLGLVDCSPSKYYYENSTVCFVCDKMDACFGYGWVSWDGEKMNPKWVPYLKNIEEINVKAADFYNYGVASKLSCEPFNKTALKCDYDVLMLLTEDKKDVNIVLQDTTFIGEFANIICREFVGKNAILYNETYHTYVCEGNPIIIRLTENVVKIWS